MNVSDLDVKVIVCHWCNGATDREIERWTHCDRPSVLWALSRVAIANDLMSTKDLRDYDADLLLERYEQYEEESTGYRGKVPPDAAIEPDSGMTAKQRIAACEELLRRLERHHGQRARMPH